MWGNLLDFEWRDVIILDSDNEVVSVYNLSANGLEQANNYAELKSLFISAAETEEPPNPWHNYNIPLDVNNDTFTSPIDALLVLNQLNTVGAQALDPNATVSDYLDTNNDGFSSPIDALLVINHLNEESQQANTVAALPLPSQVEEDRFSLGSELELSPLIVDELLSEDEATGPILLDDIAATERFESRDLILAEASETTEDLLNGI